MTTDAASLLSVETLAAAYGRTQALRNVTISVGRSEIVTLIGCNGAGKSTTLMAISGLVRKTGGVVRFDGRDITATAPHEIVQAGLIHVPEGRRIFPRLTVLENLRMGGFSKGGIGAGDLDRAFAIFPILAERRHQPGGTLSGGEQQMLAIARGLMAKPRMLLLDEPSLGIAPMLVDRIFTALKEIHASGCPILLVEQNARRALEIADRAYVIETGEVTLSGTGRELLEDGQVAKAYLGI